MTTTITLTGTASAGVDFDAYIAEFFSSFDMDNFPSFVSDQMFFSGIVDESDPESTPLVVLSGSDFAYYYPTHTVSGEATGISLGTLGDSVLSDGSLDTDSAGRIRNYSSVVTITGLDISNSASTQGELHEFVAALMGMRDTLDPSILLDEIASGSVRLNGSAGGDVFTGTRYADTLYGNNGNDTLNGALGNDRIYGGAGNDSLLGGSGNDTIDGGSGNDRISGDAGNDSLIGGSGHDTLIGGAGYDTMEGGAGNDVYYVDSTRDVVIEAASAGTDTVYSTISLTLSDNVERLTLTGSANLRGTGNDLANLIIGNSGANVLSGGDGRDTLNGGAGNDSLLGGAGNDSLIGGDGIDVLNGGSGSDTMVGGVGNDIYYVDSAGDRIVETSSGGTDTVYSTVSHTLASYVERLTLTGTANLSGTGNTLANLITGNSGANVLSGGNGNDTVNGGAGNDALSGGSGNDSLLGGTGNDTLDGGAGNDILTGGHGADILTGGAGRDTFVFASLSDSRTVASGRDTITDFSSYDTIDLSALDANTGKSGDQAFSFIGTASFSGTAGELNYRATSAGLYVYGDVDGDGTADFSIIVQGVSVLRASDFEL